MCLLEGDCDIAAGIVVRNSNRLVLFERRRGFLIDSSDYTDNFACNETKEIS